MGRGNSLARDLHIKNPAAGLQALRQAHFVPIDLMHLTTLDIHGKETQLNSASSIAVGYPAAVTRTASGRFRRFGRYSYLLAAATVRQRAFALEIRSDGMAGVKKTLTGLIANNTRHMASFIAFPEADYCDGRFDVMELRAGYLAQFLHAASALSKKPIYSPCRPFQLTRAEIILSAPQDLMVDGELFEDIVSFQVSILPSALYCCRNGN
jgi:diacylglycerol kinase family enzyme